MEELFKSISQAVLEGDCGRVESLANEVLEKGIDPVDAIQKGGVAGLEELGDRFHRLEVFLPELVRGAEAMKVLIGKLTSRISGEGDARRGTVVIGTVKGDLHDIGKNLVSTMLAVNGFNVIDLGVDVGVRVFEERAVEANADIIALSSLMTTSAYYQGELIERLERSGLRTRFFVIVGGGPITADWARKIKADGYARTSVGAVQLCKELLSKARPVGSDTLIYD